MSLQLYMDEHVRGAITKGLRQRGVDVVTVQEDGRRGADDPELLDRATLLGRVVFTQDEDFLIEAARRQRSGEFFAGVIFAEQTGPSIGRCVQDLELMAGVYDPADLANLVQYLPLK